MVNQDQTFNMRRKVVLHAEFFAAEEITGNARKRGGEENGSGDCPAFLRAAPARAKNWSGKQFFESIGRPFLSFW